MNINILNQFSSKVNSLSLKSLLNTEIFNDKTLKEEKIKELQLEIESKPEVEMFWLDVEIQQIKKTVDLIDVKHFNDFKCALLPELFQAEVSKLVAKNYKNDFNSYFNQVSLYFENVSLFDLFLLNNDNEVIKQFAYDVFDSKVQATKKLNFGAHRAYRQLLRYRKKRIAHIQALLLLVGKGGKKYCSDSLLKLYKINIRKQIKFIESYQVMNEDGELFDLKNCVKTYEHDLAEKINLSKTMEKLASDKGMVWSFITLTILPQYHPNPLNGNSSYDGTPIDESAKDVNRRFNNVRAILSKQAIETMYCKVSEVHQDGCFHFHILMYHYANDLLDIQKAFLKHFPNIDLKNGGFRTQDKSLKDSASGASYIFKYITKAVTFYNPNLDLDKLDKAEYNTLLNSAMRSFASIRGIQFGGISSCMTKFRFLARNIKRFNLPEQLVQILQDNNIYEFIKNGYCDLVQSIYESVENQEKEISKRFVGVKFSAVEMIKAFYKLVRNCIDDKPKAKPIKKISFKLRKVLVNHNYSSESQKQRQNQNQMLLE